MTGFWQRLNSPIVRHVNQMQRKLRSRSPKLMTYISNCLSADRVANGGVYLNTQGQRRSPGPEMPRGLDKPSQQTRLSPTLLRTNCLGDSGQGGRAPYYQGESTNVISRKEQVCAVPSREPEPRVPGPQHAWLRSGARGTEQASLRGS